MRGVARLRTLQPPAWQTILPLRHGPSLYSPAANGGRCRGKKGEEPRAEATQGRTPLEGALDVRSGSGGTLRPRQTGYLRL